MVIEISLVTKGNFQILHSLLFRNHFIYYYIINNDSEKKFLVLIDNNFIIFKTGN